MQIVTVNLYREADLKKKKKDKNTKIGMIKRLITGPEEISVVRIQISLINHLGLSGTKKTLAGEIDKKMIVFMLFWIIVTSSKGLIKLNISLFKNCLIWILKEMGGGGDEMYSFKCNNESSHVLSGYLKENYLLNYCRIY